MTLGGSHVDTHGFIEAEHHLVQVGRGSRSIGRSLGVGDKHAMKLLYARHNVRVYRFDLRLTNDSALVEDVVSEVFIDVWRKADDFAAHGRWDQCALIAASGQLGCPDHY
jgi:Sigma-70 region 2